MLLSPLPMHIPDGFLSVVVSVFFWLISVGVIGFALRKVNQVIGEREVPLMGVLAAAIFAGQMLNFTVTGGTSGHLMGAALATILVGPWAAILVMTSVVSVQALVFQDGGLLVLGANIFNMGILGVVVSAMVMQFIRKIFHNRKKYILGGSVIAGWLSIFIASLAAGLELAISGTSPVQIAVPAMAGIHALIGIGEGLITLGAVSFLYINRPDLVTHPNEAKNANSGIVVAGVILTVLLAVLSPLASSHPDGLEWVAEKAAFLNFAKESTYQIIPDYLLPGLQNEAVATIFAGLIGAVIVFGVIFVMMNQRKKQLPQRETDFE